MSIESVVLSYRNDRVCGDVVAIPDWEGFEKIVKFLEKYYGARVRARSDGPDARRWILEVDDGTVELHHEDPCGNTLISMSPETKSCAYCTRSWRAQDGMTARARENLPES